MIKAQNLVAGQWQDNLKAPTFCTLNPITNKPLPTQFQEASSSQIHDTLIKASTIYESYASTSFKVRIEFLQSIQKELNKSSNDILKTYQEESALPSPRAEGEFQRTIDQIQRYIELLEEGTFIQPKINTSGPDLRKILYPIGPIAVFGASNFPLAFSTAGGDTISVLASGCPLIVKAHPYHAGTSALVAEAILKAISYCGLPKEIFSHLGGVSHRIGGELVSHPLLKGVGFTGSLSGGKALYDLAQKREEPIPVFAEMGSVNPILITEKRLLTDKNLSETLANSIAQGTGQFCTNPGMIILCDPQGISKITSKVIDHLSKMILPPMVHINIEKNYLLQLDKLQENEAVTLVRTSSSNSAIGVVSAEDVLKNKKLTEEIFGPFSLFVECKSMNQLKDLVKIIPGQLTATILAHKDDHSELVPLVTQLKNKVGRLLFEGVPTGVAVNQAMQHGGPYPASTDGRYTSIGTDAIYRWLRPITFQDCPNTLLPPILQNENPLKIYRLINGQITKDTL